MSGQFQELDDRIKTLDTALIKIETQFEQQDHKVTNLIEKKAEQSETYLKDAEMLLYNVQGAYQVQKQQIDKVEDRLVKEI